MNELDDLYQEMILGHARSPRNFGTLKPCDRSANGHNPLCGDRIAVYLRMNGRAVSEIAFDGAGCAICTASASLMTDAVKGLEREAIDRVFESVHNLATGKSTDGGDLGKLAVFSGVSAFPMRVKCATLPWHTLQAALDSNATPVTTE
jgi:nitrogen fixation NifU-like protein